jgi:hypothetical protein
MSNLPRISVALDKDAAGGVNALLSSPGVSDLWDPTTGERTSGAGGLSLMGLDAFTLAIAFYDASDPEDTPSAYLFDTDYEVTASLAERSTLLAEEIAELVRLGAFTRNADDSNYTITLDLDTQEIADALEENESISCILDVRVASATLRLSYRIPVTLYRPALGTVAGDEPTVTAWANVDGSQMRQRTDGLIEWWDYDLEAWVLPVLKSGVLQFQQGA